MSTAGELWQKMQQGNVRSLARAISLIENETAGSEELLLKITTRKSWVIGITGPPGAGKSTLVDGFIEHLVSINKTVCVLCVDPTSPFNYGAILGDRIRMNAWHAHPAVYIRSLGSRGSLGGLHPRIIEITDLVSTLFDYVIVETVGVGQSEVEIAGLADVTVVVLVPESGDSVQTMKAGLMEIADIFVVNKGDRPGTDAMIKNLRLMLPHARNGEHREVPVVKTIASTKAGISDLFTQVLALTKHVNHKKIWLLAEKAFLLIQSRRMQHIDRKELARHITLSLQQGSFNLHAFVRQFDKL